MKIAYFGYNALSSCLQLLLQRGHEVVCIYSGDPSPHTDRVHRYAQQKQIPLHSHKPDMTQLQALVDSGVELFIAAEYPWQIPLPPSLPYAVNIHPTLLPHGRGPTPLPSMLLNPEEYAEHAGISLHKMTNQLDRGDILLQQELTLAPGESFDTLSAKLYLQAPPLLDQLLAKLPHYYKRSQPQTAGSDWPKVILQQQSLDWNNTTEELLLQVRAFGSLGVSPKFRGRGA